MNVSKLNTRLTKLEDSPAFRQDKVPLVLMENDPVPEGNTRPILRIVFEDVMPVDSRANLLGLE